MVRGDPNFGKRGFGSRPKEVDDEYRARAKGVPKKRKWTDDKIHDFIDEMLSLYKKILMDEKKINKKGANLKAETIRDMNNMMDRLLQFKEKYYPTVQKNLNVNVDITANAVLDRLKNWKGKQIEIIEGGDENE